MSTYIDFFNFKKADFRKLALYLEQNDIGTPALSVEQQWSFLHSTLIRACKLLICTQDKGIKQEIHPLAYTHHQTSLEEIMHSEEIVS